MTQASASLPGDAVGSATVPILVGIDVGTTNLKVLATTVDGRVVRVVQRAMTIHRPAPGQAEFDLGVVEAGILEGLSEIAAALPAGAEVAAIAVASIGESVVAVDADGVPVSVCPTWFDRRTHNYRPDFGIPMERWYDLTGMVDDDICTAFRIHWLRSHGLVDAARTKLWLCMADYCVYRLTGDARAAPALAARTGMYDRNRGTWAPEVLAALGLDVASLPLPLPTATVAGGLLPDVARRVGLASGTPVVNAGHDHPCAGVGCGLVEPGVVMDSTGTAEAVKTVVRGPLSYHETLQGRYECYPHAVPGRFILSGHLPSAGGFLAWLSKTLHGVDEDGSTPVAAIVAAARQSPPGAGGVRVLPFLEGTGEPYNRRDQAAELLGLRAYHGRADLYRAAFEGCAFWFEVNVSAMSRIANQPIGAITAVGGGARSDLWLEIKSAFVGRPMWVPDVEEAAAFGAALVGGMAVGLVGTAADDLPKLTGRNVVAPAALRAAYEPVAAEYRALYEQRFGPL